MTVLDRVVRWNLDLDGDGTIYGDERERLRWYEGIATAASLQWLAIPWAAAVLVWVLGRPSVLPLAVVLAALIVPMAVCTAYVRRRRVDTEVHSWNRKRVLLAAGFGLPIVTFVIGAFYAYAGPASSVWRGAIVGAAFGGLLGVAASVLSARRKRREEATAAGDEG
jgi:hypothetical protein